MLEIRHLRILRAVAAEGSVTGAADALGFTASAVSQQLASLGRLIGQPVVRRQGRGVVLTPAGRSLASDAEYILAAVALAESEARDTGATVGALRVASFATAARRLLIPAIAALSRPGLQIAVTEAEPEQALPMLTGGSVDVALLYSYDLLPFEPVAVTLFPLAEEPLVLVCSAELAHSLRGQQVKLAQMHWIAGPSETEDYELTRRLCGQLGFEPRISHAVEDYALTLALAAAGQGVAFVPRDTVAMYPRPKGLRVLQWPAISACRHVWFAVQGGHERRPGPAALLRALRGPTTKASSRLKSG